MSTRTWGSQPVLAKIQMMFGFLKDRGFSEPEIENDVGSTVTFVGQSVAIVIEIDWRECTALSRIQPLANTLRGPYVRSVLSDQFPPPSRKNCSSREPRGEERMLQELESEAQILMLNLDEVVGRFAPTG